MYSQRCCSASTSIGCCNGVGCRGSNLSRCVPLIAPVVLLKLSPAGRDGEIDQFVGAPPPVVGETVDMVVPLTNVSELGE